MSDEKEIVPGPRLRSIAPSRALHLALLVAWISGISMRASAGLGASPAVGSPPDMGFDDPKLAREIGIPRLGASATAIGGRAAVASVVPRVVVPVPATVQDRPDAAKPLAAAQAPAPAATPPRPAKPATPPVAERATARPSARDVVPKRVALADTADGTAARSADIVAIHKVDREVAPVPPEPATGPWPYAPRMKLSYRRFPFARVASTAPAITAGALDPTRPESFESVSLDLYPISWYLRVGLSTQFGWESGQFDRTGDYFFAESASVGFQIPGRFTPFVEALAGAGYMRRKQVDYELPTAYWQTGIDAGLEIYFARRMYLSLAAGYIHPGNLFLKDQSLRSVNADTWSLKIGLGI